MNFGSFVRRFVAQQATDRLRREPAQPAQQSCGSSTASEPRVDAAVASAAPTGCDVGIIFALGEEAGGTEDLLSAAITTKGKGFTVREGVLGTRRVTVIRGGAGREAAIRATQALIVGHRPSWVISAGFSGALQPDLRRNDFVMADEIVDFAGHNLSINLQADSDPRARLYVGRILTVDRLIHDRNEKQALGAAHHALAADMESWFVGDVCRQSKTRFMAVRIISDAIDDALPADLDRLITPTTAAGRAGAVIGTLFRRPSSIKDMLQLRERALIATDRLARFLSVIVEQLAADNQAS